MDFATNLKRLRHEKKIGQKELADALSISVKTVSHWETGYSEPSLDLVVRTAAYFDVTVGELLGTEEI